MEKGGRRRAAILGPLRKEEKEEEEVDVPFKSPRGAPLIGSSATSLRCAPTTASSEDAETGGHLRVAKHSVERKFGESGIQSGTSN